jgi:hypothetical protein
VLRFSSLLQRRRRLTLALVAALALALPASAADARPAKWSAPTGATADSGSGSPSDFRVHINRSSWT